MIQSAVIGVGGIGKEHLSYMKGSGQMQVRAICDANEQWRTWARQEYPEAAFYTDAQAMFAKEKLDLVTLACPHNLHAPLAIAALKAGVNVITEKPMATTYAEARAMIAASQAAGKFLTVYHNRRLDPWFLAAMDVMRAGWLGDLYELNTGIIYGGRWESWRGFKKSNGGILFDWGAHQVDWMLHLAGSEVKAVSGFFRRGPRTEPERNEDFGTLRIYFASGAIANVTNTGLDCVQPLRYRITGANGTLVDEWQFDDKGKLKVHLRLPAGGKGTLEVDYHKARKQAYYDNIAAHLREGKPLLVSAESAAQVINVLCAAHRSHDQGGVPVPLE